MTESAKAFPKRTRKADYLKATKIIEACIAKGKRTEGICVVLGDVHYKSSLGYFHAPWVGWTGMQPYYPEFKNVACPRMDSDNEVHNELRLKILKRALKDLEAS